MHSGVRGFDRATAERSGAVEVVLSGLVASELFDLVDIELARMFVRRSHIHPDQTTSLTVALLLLSRARREGHSALLLSQIVDQLQEIERVVPGVLPADILARDIASWRALYLSTQAGSSDEPSLVVLHDDRLQFLRFFLAESRIAATLHDMVLAPSVGGLPRFSIVTGGPGTGKTTHVAQRLLELRTSHPALRIALAAPTGKAAARLTESIGVRVAQLASDSSVVVTESASTLHRLLGYSARTDRYRQNATNPLPFDLVIVDEASMVDVLMFDALLQALHDGAQLMLVGDHHQLASVDTGNVLASLCDAALGATINSPLHRAVTVLTKSWRFAEQPAIGALAAAILAGDATATLAACEPGVGRTVQRHAITNNADTLLTPLLPGLARCLAAQSPDELLTAVESFRLLAPEREGPLGVHGLNQLVERWLASSGRSVADLWYHGRPILVTSNDYSSGIFNGDVGVVWREQGQVAVYFRATNNSLRAISPNRLPPNETAWAMTVHKSQGSEFDEVIVVLPEHDSRVMNRELLYTAVTRAREQVTLLGSEQSVTTAVSRSTARTSGLSAQLAALFA